MADKSTPGLPPNIFGDAALQQFGEKSFTTPVDTGSAPDYLGYSKGTDRVPVNSSVGDAFKNAGTFLTDATNTATKDIGLKLKQDVDTQVDEIHKKFGVDQVAALAASGQAPGPFKGDPDIFGTANPVAAGKVKGAPPGVAKFGDSVESIQQSYDQGMLSNTAYHGQLTALVKQVTAQYGSMWGDEIQKAVQEKTGIIPAEALRKDILSDKDAEERAKQGAGQKDLQFIRENLKYTPLAPQISMALDRGKANDPQYVSMVKALIYAGQSQEHSLNALKATEPFVKGNDGKMTIDPKSGQPVMRDDYARKVTGIFQSDVTQFMTTNATVAGIDTPGKINDIVKKHDANGGGGWTPDDIQRITAHSQTNLAQMEAAATKKMWSPGPNGEPSIGQQIGKDAADGIIKSSLIPMQNQVNRIINGDHGIAGTIAAANKQDEAFVRQDMNRAFPILLKTEVAQKALGPSLTSDALVGMKDQYGAIAKAFAGAIGMTVEAGGTPPPNNPNGALRPATLQSQVDKASNLARNDTEKYEIKAGTVDMMIRGLLNPKGNQDSANKFATALFSVDNKDFLSKNFSPALQPQFFNQLTSRAVTDRIDALSKDNPTIKGQYAQWVGNTFTGVMKQKADDIRDIESSGQYLFRYSPEKNQLEWTETKTRGPYASPAEDAYRRRVQATVTPINEMLYNLQEVAKRNNTSVPQLFHDGIAGTGLNMGVDFANPKTPKEEQNQGGLMVDMKRWFAPPETSKSGYVKDQSSVNPR